MGRRAKLVDPDIGHNVIDFAYSQGALHAVGIGPSTIEFIALARRFNTGARAAMLDQFKAGLRDERRHGPADLLKSDGSTAED